MAKSTKTRIYEILEPDNPYDRTAEAVNLFMLVLVILNVAAVVLETVESIYSAHRELFHLFSDISVIIFSIEYILRLWSCDVDDRYSRPISGRIRFALAPLSLIDLMVILPAYVALVFPADHILLRSLRVLWTIRLLKLSRYSKSLQTIMDVISAQKRELFMSFSAIGFFMVLSSTLIYFLEHDAQPQHFPDIPATMWWAVLTMTTVGENYYPVTPMGKVVGALIIILGVATFALPTSILTSGFVEELEKRREEREAARREETEDGP
ncbi:MAG: Voltage-gated potassium channel [Methanosaeta sp. PtaU1.Bin112]|nr:MAG: Voltage-gated potassium channel [Methanosaeta sp. PtaU1.Bin112]